MLETMNQSFQKYTASLCFSGVTGKVRVGTKYRVGKGHCESPMLSTALPTPYIFPLQTLLQWNHDRINFAIVPGWSVSLHSFMAILIISIIF